MAGGKRRPRKDFGLKACQGQVVKTGNLLTANATLYKAGINVQGHATLIALCPGKVYFTRKKTSHGKFRTFVNVKPSAE